MVIRLNLDNFACCCIYILIIKLGIVHKLTSRFFGFVVPLSDIKSFAPRFLLYASFAASAVIRFSAGAKLISVVYVM